MEREALESRRGPARCERGLKYFGFANAKCGLTKPQEIFITAECNVRLWTKVRPPLWVEADVRRRRVSEGTRGNNETNPTGITSGLFFLLYSR